MEFRLVRHGILIWLSLAYGSLAQGLGLAARSYTWLSADRADFCRDVRSAPAVLDETSAYPQTPFDQQEGADARGILQGYRDDDYLLNLFRSCPLVEPIISSECSTELEEYLFSLLLFGSPIMAGLFFMLLWQVCCCTAMCRCCRRCCLCAERKAPYSVRLWQKISIACLVPIGVIAGLAAVFVVYTRSETFTVAVQEVLCHSLTMADEALNGSPSGPLFLGIDAGIQRVALLQQLLDVDSKAMTDIRAILDETAPFGDAVDDLLAKVDHMQRVLTLVGQQKLKEHTCWFCIRAIGSNSTGEEGLLNELKLALRTSSADAMQSIRETTSATLTGQRLADVASAAGRGRNALEVFKQATAGSFVEMFLGQRYTLQTVEDARHTAFLALSGFTAVLVLLVNPGTIVYARRSKATYPSASPSCASWFCSFCALSFGLLFAGGLLVVAVPMSELCHFWRYDLLTHGGIADYYQQLGLYNEADPAQNIDPYATDVFRTCFTGNGTGNIIAALQLQEPLSFQQVLDEKFIELEDKQAAMVVDTARYELLVSQARLFGGLFLLEPDQPLALDPAWASKLLGSSLDPDDQVGPDGESLISGLNTYASSIAGPGQYAFEHGTSGGGILITATEPSEASVSNLPIRTQNALAYARLKEQILSEDRLLRCDVMDGNYIVTERFCTYDEFKVHVLDMAEQVRAAGMVLSTQANAAKELLATDLKSTLQSILMEVQQLRTLLGCRFLWRRWEEFDFTFCNVALPNAIECCLAALVLAVAALILALVHYKMWRHLLDNKVVGEELEKFSKKYGYLQTRK